MVKRWTCLDLLGPVYQFQNVCISSQFTSCSFRLHHVVLVHLSSVLLSLHAVFEFIILNATRVPPTGLTFFIPVLAPTRVSYLDTKLNDPIQCDNTKSATLRPACAAM